MERNKATAKQSQPGQLLGCSWSLVSLHFRCWILRSRPVHAAGRFFKHCPNPHMYEGFLVKSACLSACYTCHTAGMRHSTAFKEQENFVSHVWAGGAGETRAVFSQSKKPAREWTRIQCPHRFSSVFLQFKRFLNWWIGLRGGALVLSKQGRQLRCACVNCPAVSDWLTDWLTVGSRPSHSAERKSWRGGRASGGESWEAEVTLRTSQLDHHRRRRLHSLMSSKR